MKTITISREFGSGGRELRKRFADGLDQNYVEDKLNYYRWKYFPFSFRGTIGSATYIQLNKVTHNPFNIFVCADVEAKVKRCMERASESEQLTKKDIVQKMKEIDNIRSQTRDILSDTNWGQRDAYHLTINTSDWNIKDLAPAVAAFASSWFGRDS